MIHDLEAPLDGVSDESLIETIQLIEENLKEAGARSHYATRVSAPFRRMKREARKRGLTWN